MHLLIPDLLSTPEFLEQALAGLSLPGLEALLLNATAAKESMSHDLDARYPTPSLQPEMARSTPAWRWLYKQCGHEIPIEGCAPHAAAWMRQLPQGKSDGWWHLLAPCHFAATSDHLLLAGLAGHAEALHMTDAESIALAQSCRELLPSNARLACLAPRLWLLSYPIIDAIRTTDPIRAMGRNVDAWLPSDLHARGEAARAWRRLHNEIQMAWHFHPVNEARSAQRRLPINALWLYGGAQLGDLPKAHWNHIIADEIDPQLVALAEAWDVSSAFGVLHCSSDMVEGLSMPSDKSLVWLGALTRPAIDENIGAWRSALSRLDRDWLQALAEARIPFTLTMCSEHGSRSVRVKGNPRWAQRLCFWKRQSLQEQLSA
jgi:hypothetical protein